MSSILLAPFGWLAQGDNGSRLYSTRSFYLAYPYCQCDQRCWIHYYHRSLEPWSARLVHWALTLRNRCRDLPSFISAIGMPWVRASAWQTMAFKNMRTTRIAEKASEKDRQQSQPGYWSVQLKFLSSAQSIVLYISYSFHLIGAHDNGGRCYAYVVDHLAWKDMLWCQLCPSCSTSEMSILHALVNAQSTVKSDVADCKCGFSSRHLCYNCSKKVHASIMSSRYVRQPFKIDYAIWDINKQWQGHLCSISCSQE